MKKHIKIAIAAVLIVCIACGQAFAQSASTPIRLTIKDAGQEEPSKPSRPSRPSGTIEVPEKPDPPEDIDFSDFSEEEKENYQKLSAEGKVLVRKVKSVQWKMYSANSKLHNKKAVVVSWENDDEKKIGKIKWKGYAIYRVARKGAVSSKPFFTVKNKKWYKNNLRVKNEKKYYYTVRSYIFVEGYRFYSKPSPETNTLIQPKAAFSKVEKKNFKKLSTVQKAHVNRIKKATTKLTIGTAGGKTVLRWASYDSYRAKPLKTKWSGVDIYRAKKTSPKDMTKIVTIKSGKSYMIKGTSAQYCYRIRPYITENGKKYYGQYSDIAVISER